MRTGHTVLVVDDEDGVRKAIVKLLKYEPYRVIDSADPEEALRIVMNEDVHLILSDHMMPKMLGMDLLRKIHLLKPDTVRIVLTGHADLEMAMQAINEGAIYRFLTKPWDNDELLLALRLGLQLYEKEEENRRLLKLVRRHWEILQRLESDSPGSTGLNRRADGSIVLGDDELDAVLRELDAEVDDLEEKTVETELDR